MSAETLTEAFERVLLDHVLMGDYDGDDFECSCGEKYPAPDDMYEVEYTPRLAITEELRRHAVHLAAVLTSAARGREDER